MLENGIIPAATSIAERKTQIQTLLENSGLFTWVRSRDTYSDIYTPEYCPARKARISYMFGGINFFSESYHQNYSRSYLYPNTFDDSGLGVPVMTDCLELGYSLSTSNVFPGETVGYQSLPNYNVSFPYVIVKNLNSSYLNLNNGTIKMVGVKSASAKKMFSLFVNPAPWRAPYTASSVGPNKYANIAQLKDSQYSFAHYFTLDTVKMHDRLIQHLLPMDYPDASTVSINGGYLTNDPILDLFSFSNTGVTLTAEQIYTDIDTGKRYLCIYDRTLLKLD